MKIKVPDYFLKFKCVAENCKDNCCIGWDVKLDEKARSKCLSSSVVQAKDISSFIIEVDGESYIKMKSDGRCPFLTDNNLCSFICSGKEDHLSEICREHPRYYNVYSTLCEGGLGMCCEEAARVMFDTSLPLKYVEYDDPEIIAPSASLELMDPGLLAEEREALEKSILGLSAKDVFRKIAKSTSYSFNRISYKSAMEIICSVYEKCDLLDSSHLKSIKEPEFDKTSFDHGCLAKIRGLTTIRIITYCLHRHFLDAVFDGCRDERLWLALLIDTIITLICYNEGVFEKEGITLVAKDVTKSLEYSSGNIEMLLDYIAENPELIDAIGSLYTEGE